MLNDSQLAALTKVFCQGSEDASHAMSRWLGRPARVSTEQIEQVPLAEATDVLGIRDSPVCSLCDGLAWVVLASGYALIPVVRRCQRAGAGRSFAGETCWYLEELGRNGDLSRAGDGQHYRLRLSEHVGAVGRRIPVEKSAGSCSLSPSL